MLKDGLIPHQLTQLEPLLKRSHLLLHLVLYELIREQTLDKLQLKCQRLLDKIQVMLKSLHMRFTGMQDQEQSSQLLLECSLLIQTESILKQCQMQDNINSITRFKMRMVGLLRAQSLKLQQQLRQILQALHQLSLTQIKSV